MILLVVANTARSLGRVFGSLAITALVGFGIVRLGRRFRVSTPLLVVLAVLVVGMMILAGVAGSHKK